MRRCLAWLAMMLLAGCAGPTPEAADAPHAEGAQATDATGSADAPAPTTPRTPRPFTLDAPTASGPAETDATANDVVVAVLDTGLRADHAAFAPGQVVAWYDFGAPGRSGVPTVTWDPTIPMTDGDGHGTATASLVAGNGTPSLSPGTSLAIARISGPSGSASWSDTADAIRWAVDTVGADVVSLSFYAYLPQAGLDHVLLEALEYARSQGVLPVVLAGNGLDNAGLPAVSWMHPPASSPHALVVGGASGAGVPNPPRSHLEPEVTAPYSLKQACIGSSTCYRTSGGTSFSTPYAAGLVARMLETAEANGLAAPTADRLERIVQGCVRDTVHPPTMEGYGFVDAGTTTSCATAHVLAGTTPSPDVVNDAYVSVVQDGARRAWSGDL